MTPPTLWGVDPLVIYSDPTEGYHVVPPDHELAASTRRNELVLVATPCPDGAGEAPCSLWFGLAGEPGGEHTTRWWTVPMEVITRISLDDERVAVTLKFFQP